MKRIPLEGRRFGRLLVTARAANVAERAAYNCVCDCGQHATVRAESLRRGVTSSCGCLRSEIATSRQTRHGMYGTPIYRSWRAMLARCTDHTHPQFKDYGGRGINVCERWQKFENFLADLGDRPADRTLDRQNNDRGYEPGNCRWATAMEQRSNRRDAPRSSK